jgi:uncharacterized protein (TIGR00730 family)
MMKRVAIYGGSIVRPDEADYKAAYAIGKGLAEAGHAVMTGGYSGIMEAASRGAAEAGGHVIGVTAQSIERYRPTSRANQWVTEELPQTSLRDRMMILILQPDAYVIMPGGLGTLNELTAAWELVRIGELPKRPIICYGSYWKDILAAFRESRYLASDGWATLDFADTVGDIVKIIDGKLKP